VLCLTASDDNKVRLPCSLSHNDNGVIITNHCFVLCYMANLSEFSTKVEFFLLCLETKILKNMGFADAFH